MQIHKVALVGLGALGIMYAELLTKALGKENVRVVADRERIMRYQGEGIYCNGALCDFQYVLPEQDTEPADLLLFTVKSGGLHSAIKAARGQVGEHTLILSAVNGIESEELLAKAYGEKHVLYCVAQAMDAVREHNCVRYISSGQLCFGEKEPGPLSERVKAVSDFFEQAGIGHKAVTDIRHHQWGKLMANVGLNQVTALTDPGTYSVVQKEGPARARMIAAMREVQAVAEAEGVHLGEQDMDYWLGVIDRLNPLGKTSMRQDVEAGRRTEVELFAGTVLRLGRKHGIDVPVNERLEREILCLTLNAV